MFLVALWMVMFERKLAATAAKSEVACSILSLIALLYSVQLLFEPIRQYNTLGIVVYIVQYIRV